MDTFFLLQCKTYGIYRQKYICIFFNLSSRKKVAANFLKALYMLTVCTRQGKKHNNSARQVICRNLSYTFIINAI